MSIGQHFWSNASAILFAERISETDLSKRIGRGRTYVSDQIARGAAPTLDDAERIAIALGCPLGELIAPPTLAATSTVDRSGSLAARAIARAGDLDGMRADAPSIDTVLAWYHANGGRLEHHDALMPYIEIFADPGGINGNPAPVQVGRLSAASFELGFEGVEDLAEMFRDNPATAAACVAAHRTTLALGQFRLSEHTIDLRFAHVMRSIRYHRLLLPVQEGQHRRILLYSAVIKRTSTAGKQGVELCPARRQKPILVDFV